MQIVSKLASNKLLRTIALLMRNFIVSIRQNTWDLQELRQESCKRTWKCIRTRRVIKVCRPQSSDSRHNGRNLWIRQRELSVSSTAQ